MTKQEMAQSMNQFVLMSFVSPENIQTGFLTRQRVNSLENNQIVAFSQETENIVNQLVKNFANAVKGIVPDYTDCGTLFQYVFDKTTEATYKLVTGEEVDTQFMLKEAYEYHEPDLPEYIQLKLTNVVGPTSIISTKILHYLDENECRTKDVEQWMTAYLMVAVVLAIEFAQEINPDDNSEMQHYLHDD
jgi:hypothetical protein